MPAGFLQGSSNWSDLLVVLGLVLGAAYAAASAAAWLARSVFVRALGGSEAETLSTPAVRRPVRFVRASVFFLTAIALGVPAFRLAGASAYVGMGPEALIRWFLDSGLRILLIGIAAYVLLRALGVVIQRLEHEASHGTGLDVLERAKRAKTLGSLITNVVGTLIVSITGLMMLRELGVDILPLLTGAGIVGLAVGFGAQTLVRDVIAGFFLILENQVRVGDMAVINGVVGGVEAINLRTIVLRDIAGAVHVFPNGAITTLANRSRDFAYALVDVKVPFRANLNEMIEDIKGAGAEMAQNPAFAPHILEPLEVLGIEGFDDTNVLVRVRMKTVPLKQLEVARALRWRLKKVFDKRGLGAPYPQVSVNFGGGPP